MPLASLNRMELERFVPKYVRLRQQLMTRIRQLEPGQSLPPIAAIRKQYKVSQPTVDRAIQELRSEGLLQSRRGSGVYVTELAKIVKAGVVMEHDPVNPNSRFSQALVDSIQAQSASRGMLLRFYIGRQFLQKNAVGANQFFLDLEAGRLDGLLTTSGPQSDMLMELGLPAVMLGYRPEEPRQVTMDYPSVVELGTQALVARGCKRIGQFGHASPKLLNEREAFESILTHANLPSTGQWSYYWDRVTSLELVGYRAFMRLWPQWNPKPDALICTDDNVTSGILHAAEELGVRIGTDLHIASHANRGLSNFGKSSVIRIEFDVDQVANTMLECLLHQVHEDPLPMQARVIKPTLIS